MDRLVVEAVAPELLDVLRTGRRGCQRQLDRVVAESTCARVEVGSPVVVLGVPSELLWCALVTEVVGVRAASVVAVVRGRDDGGEELALLARQARRSRQIGRAHV